MTHILTLIGNKTTTLTDKTVAAAAEKLPGAGKPDWLAENHACDIAFTPETHNIKALEAEIRQTLSGIDLALLPKDNRRKKLLIADMDSTIIEQECIDELADLVGLKPQVAEITERAMRGEIDFEPALKERVALLAGLDTSQLEKVYETRITQTPGGRALTATMRAHGGHCALVSGGFMFFTTRVADAVGFDSQQANRLIEQDGKLTGQVAEPILGKQAKLSALQTCAREQNLKPEETLAVGDGANDLAMLDAAGLGVAFHAKPVVAERAHARIDHGDLTALLYLQGYRSGDIKAA